MKCPNFLRKTRNNRVFRAAIAGGLTIFAVKILTACGIPGGVPFSNDPLPPGAVFLYHGTLSSAAGVTGATRVYLNGNSVLLRMVDLRTPTGSSYAVFLESSGSPALFYSAPLKTGSGTQNYSTGRALPTGTGEVFTRVVIRETFSPLATEVASSALVPITP